MIKIVNTEVFGWETAIRGMRNPMNSWEKSDSYYCDGFHCTEGNTCDREHCGDPDGFYIGKNDLKLMQNLSRAGSDHGKFLRMINVTCDITAPLYWWKEFDTYKVGTVANSCSTMHKIHAKEFTLDDFSTEHLDLRSITILTRLIDCMNANRTIFNVERDKEAWWQMIQLLPTSYNQRRTVQLNYQVLKAMDSRENHKLDEWHGFIDWRNALPYYKEICKVS